MKVPAVIVHFALAAVLSLEIWTLAKLSKLSEDVACLKTQVAMISHSQPMASLTP